mmetsp:Transcript_104129/g.238460  ORF Transcript_104129/g.238460 Transcript_104129/m.238460 type:complete len:927 (-) Transcript_104129:63-2843(-)
MWSVGLTALLWCTVTPERIARNWRPGSGLVEHECYHAGMDNAARKSVQDAFLDDRIQIVVATVAFGMGIDKPSIRRVVHWGPPHTIEHYVQQTGRAGRDGEPSECIMYWTPGDRGTSRSFLASMSESSTNVLDNVLKLNDKLYDMLHSTACLRASLLHYFGERPPPNCGNCSHCEVGKQCSQKRDFSSEARILLQCFQLCQGRTGVALPVKIAVGSRDKAVKDKGYDSSPFFGSGKMHKMEWWKNFVRLLREAELVEETTGTLASGRNYNMVGCTEKGKQFVRVGGTLNLYEPPELREAPVNQSVGQPNSPQPQSYSISTRSLQIAEGAGEKLAQDTVFAKLRDFRMQQARSRQMSDPSRLLDNAALRNLARVRPASIKSLRLVEGVPAGLEHELQVGILLQIRQVCEVAGYSYDQDLPSSAPVASASDLEQLAFAGEEIPHRAKSTPGGPWIRKSSSEDSAGPLRRQSQSWPPAAGAEACHSSTPRVFGASPLAAHGSLAPARTYMEGVQPDDGVSVGKRRLPATFGTVPGKRPSGPMHALAAALEGMRHGGKQAAGPDCTGSVSGHLTSSSGAVGDTNTGHPASPATPATISSCSASAVPEPSARASFPPRTFDWSDDEELDRQCMDIDLNSVDLNLVAPVTADCDPRGLGNSGAGGQAGSGGAVASVFDQTPAALLCSPSAVDSRAAPGAGMLRPTSHADSQHSVLPLHSDGCPDLMRSQQQVDCATREVTAEANAVDNSVTVSFQQSTRSLFSPDDDLSDLNIADGEPLASPAPPLQPSWSSLLLPSPTPAEAEQANRPGAGSGGSAVAALSAEVLCEALSRDACQDVELSQRDNEVLQQMAEVEAEHAHRLGMLPGLLIDRSQLRRLVHRDPTTADEVCSLLNASAQQAECAADLLAIMRKVQCQTPASQGSNADLLDLLA